MAFLERGGRFKLGISLPTTGELVGGRMPYQFPLAFLGKRSYEVCVRGPQRVLRSTAEIGKTKGFDPYNYEIAVRPVHPDEHD